MNNLILSLITILVFELLALPMLYTGYKATKDNNYIIAKNICLVMPFIYYSLVLFIGLI